MVPLTFDAFDLLPEPDFKMDLVPTAPFVEAYKKKSLGLCQVARAAGFMRTDRPTDPDATRVRRILERPRCKYETGVRLARGLGIPPYEAGV